MSQEQKGLLLLFLPIFFETFLMMLLGMSDTLMLSSVSDDAVGTSYLFGVTFKMGASGVFIGLVLDECIRAVFMFIRFRSGKWEKEILVKPEDRILNE